ncbi:MAG: septation protein SpoVG family protein [Candidatus Omnitrophica bacterium]|nr:putative septation protein SpoVG [bacterium]NUN96706.1 septation protein SpoVG family protein [Candidatus Omnitrophota bacterium]
MEITEVRVYPVTHEDERLLGYATITFDAAFVVRDLRLIRGTGGLFVAMPSRKRADGTYSDVAHPLNPDLRQKIETKVIAAYQEQIEKLRGGASPHGEAPSGSAEESQHKIAV